ncbi:MAG: response regulator [Parcubacteria group bacterium CG_4_9_14_0_2_um_filter_35_11]|nr:MAG: response regulator [Parcubacteria group bacterium CG07_land_8_20_14_0_80_35_11]PJC47930.1 MAG: response regulator [Parcubacteria group bacterium CG_4_9_14_0_2_um_filter_35_11]
MKKILFIEDEFTLQKSMGEFLEKAGFKIIQALDGEIGLNLAEKEKPDLILLDLILPKISGFEVLKRLKENKETKDIPVIILTNLEESTDVGKSLELGATTYLVKSDQSLDDVLERIKETLRE